MKKKIIVSLVVMAVAGAAAIGGTVAYFSDTETSPNNNFTAGKLDLKIDSTCHYDGMVCTLGATGAPATWVEEDSVNHSSTYPELIGKTCTCTWLSKDLAGDTFFNFDAKNDDGDIKPGDQGENTVSLQVHNNAAWVCANISNLRTATGDCNEPKCLANGNLWVNGACNKSCAFMLQKDLLFTVWRDYNCDNKMDYSCSGTDPVCVTLTDSTTCKANPKCSWALETAVVSDQPATELNWPIADSSTVGGPVPADEISCVGVSWRIDGPSVGNEIQGDSLTGDINFTATQSRNNPKFVCGGVVGAKLSAYVAPTGTQCNVNVPSIDITTINQGILAANPGQTVCVAAGTYPEDVVVNKSITLAGAGAATTNIGNGVRVESQNVTVKGFTIGVTTGAQGVDPFSVYLDYGSGGATVAYNVFTNVGSVASARGLINAITDGNNSNINNNKASGFATGIYLNNSSNMVVDHNTLTGNNVGLSADHPNGSTVTANIIKNNAFEGVGTVVAAADSIHVHNNNIYTNNSAPLSNLDNYDATGTVDATNNWWGGAVAAGINAQAGSAGTVNTAPVTATQYPEN